MIALHHVFWVFVFFFAVIGTMRGWAKELLVSFSVLTAIALNYLLERFGGVTFSVFNDTSSTSLFWIRVTILLSLVFFGYQTVNISRFAPQARKEKIQDSFLGFFFGAINGYAVIGTLWFYLNDVQHAFEFIQQPTDPQLQATIARYITLLPPNLIGEPGIYFAVILSLIFVLVVFL